MDRQRLVAHRHNHAGIGGRRDLQLLRDGARINGERVVARHAERARHPGQHTSAVVGHGRGFAVEEFVRPHDLRTEVHADRLMPQAHPEQWNLLFNSDSQHVQHVTCRSRFARSGG